jgi:signal transduction histidine kinase
MLSWDLLEGVISPTPQRVKHAVVRGLGAVLLVEQQRIIRSELRVDPGMRIPKIESDPSRIRQVLGNLISNAVKYTPEGRVTVHTRLRPKPGVDGAPEYVAIEVSDTGLGIPEHKRRLLFQEFTRFEPGAAKGTGIGLAIVKKAVERMGGSVGVVSSPGHGAEFWVELEAADPPSANVTKSRNPASFWTNSVPSPLQLPAAT